MGLDTVEIVISFEQAFGIEIRDEDAARMETPGMVIDFIMAEQAAGSKLVCPSMRAFHRLREALLTEHTIRRRDLSPDTQLEPLIPRKHRRKLWNSLLNHNRLALPSLRRPKWLSASLTAAVLVGALTVAIMLADSTSLRIMIGLILLWPLGWLAECLTRPLAVHLPQDCQTMASLATYLCRSKPSELLVAGEALTREQIASTVKAITCEFCNPADYREDAHFIRDLGLD